MKNALKKALILVVLAGGFAINASAQDVQELSLSECLAIGVVDNIDIKIARIESKLGKEDVRITLSMFDTIADSVVSYTDDQRDSSSSAFGTKKLITEYAAGLSKKLPIGSELSVDYSNTRNWTDSLFADNNPTHTAEISFSIRQPVLKNIFGFVDYQTVKLALIHANITDIRALDRIENAIADIEKAYWELVFTYETRTLREKLLNQAKKLYDVLSSRVKTGAAEMTEFYEAEANMQIREADLLISEKNLKNASNKLKYLLNEEGLFLISPTENLTHLGKTADLAESMEEAFTANREYAIKKKEVHARHISVKMKENSLWPEIDLVGTFALNGVNQKFTKANRRITTIKDPMYYGGVEFSVPLENNYARGEFNKARLDKERAILELMQVERKLFVMIDDYVRDVNTFKDNAERWTEIRSIQDKKLTDEAKKLKYGRSSTKILVDYQNDLTRAAISEYLAMLDYYKALIDLENAKDTLLKEVGLL